MDFNSPQFARQYHYDGGDLGARLTDTGTRFRLWAPTAQRVQLRLYPEGVVSDPLECVEMETQDRGVWYYEAPRRLAGVYYDFAVTVDGVTRTTADPYARACGCNGGRSMVVDLPATDPEGWQQDKAPARQAEDIIYEVHVREFSWDESGGFPQTYRGKYKAFTCTDTTLYGDGQHPTGLGYLRRLGVNYIQLMPVFDYGSVDEAAPDASFNWGYDPVNYNVPEGSYSLDPADGALRIRELKELVQSLHRQGFRVIMDVVYNHTYHRDSWLERTVPGYYYRYRPDGSWSEGSGCGNDLASERSMCGQYILDSVLYWAGEYHMDGFRFDLMGLLDTDLMQRIRAALDARYGRGEKLVFGEPWAAGPTACKRGTRLAGKKSLPTLDPEIGAFCDAVRDAVKGSVQHTRSAGFVNGGRGKEGAVAQSLTAWCPGGRGFHTAAPTQTITYVSCHDDVTLWDKLVDTLDPRRRYDEGTPRVLRANRLAAAVYMTCQGRLFLLSGEEFGRTKQGQRDTHNAPITLNRLDWQRAWDHRDLVDYYRGLMALRKQLPALCDKSAGAARRLLRVETPAPRCVTALLDNTGSRWGQLYLVYNASGQAYTCTPDGEDWQCLADGETTFGWQQPQTAPTFTAAPGTALILGKPSQL
nr:type I pullulanase [uncultured Gemmiger sp.]